MRKTYVLDEECLKIISEVKKKSGISTSSKTLEHIIKSYKERGDKKEELLALLEEYDKRCRGFNKGLLTAVRNAEFNSSVILNFINTMLFHSHYGDVESPVTVDIAEHRVIEDISIQLSKQIADAKQIKDNRKY